MSKHTQLNRIAKDPRVAEVSDEGIDGYWIYLKTGFICDESETHAVHEYTVKDLVRSFKSVRVCACQDCKSKETK